MYRPDSSLCMGARACLGKRAGANYQRIGSVRKEILQPSDGCIDALLIPQLARREQPYLTGKDNPGAKAS